MFTRKCNKIADAVFYNEERIPDKMLYIERVMLSCENRGQLDSAYAWGRSVIDNIYQKMSRVLCRKYALSDWIRISGRLLRNTNAVSAQLRLYYNELIGKKMW